MAAQNLTLSFFEPDIALLTFDTPNKSTNVLATAVLEELAKHLDQLEKRNDLAGMILVSGKPGQFIAGADLREFVAALDVPTAEVVQLCRRGQSLFSRLCKCPFVTVAAIDGICVGGGAEMAAWCDRRLVTDNSKTTYGFPEVKLGLFPGWGGTVRAPRIAGLGNAVEMITGGESITAKEAYAMGWASDLVPVDQLLTAAVALVRAEQKSGEYLKDRQCWSGPVDISPTELGFLGATASAVIQQQTKGHYPAPDAALETLLGAAFLEEEAACQMEAEGMATLFGSPINTALLNIFFLADRNKKDTGIERENVKPADISSVAVIGAGIMGNGIAAANVKRELPVILNDSRADALAKGVQMILDEVSYNKSTKAKDIDRTLQYAPRINATTLDAEIAACDLIIEAIIENEDVKKQVYSRLEKQLGDNTILASNTSTIPITKLAAELKHPERFCGIHFFNPVRKMKLVEVIRGQQTSDLTVATAVTHAKRLGKSPIVVNDGPGFLVNRLLLPYMNEALQLVAEGVPIPKIEAAAKKFGMPMGPITLYDVVGLDTAFYAGQVLADAWPDRIPSSSILPALVEAGRLGQKTGRGFFSYQNKKRRAQTDPELEPFLRPHVRSSSDPLASDQITDRLFLPMLLEATRVLTEHIVRDARDVDLGLIFGIGFPPFRGGLLFWADQLGADKILERLKPLESLGPRARPTNMLVEMAKSGGKFYVA